MKVARVVSLSRHRAPTFTLLSGLELIDLRKVPSLVRWLFVELVAMSDFETGRIETTYAVLMSLLDFDQAPQAHDVDLPTSKRVRNALQVLVDMRLVRLDRIKNEKGKGLFLNVKKRSGISASANMRGRLRGRPKKDEEQAPARPAADRPPDEGQTEGQGVQEEKIYPYIPCLSTARRRKKLSTADLGKPIASNEFEAAERTRLAADLAAQIEHERRRQAPSKPPVDVRQLLTETKAKIAARRAAAASSDRAPRS